MKPKIFFYALLCAAMLTACKDDEDPIQTGAVIDIPDPKFKKYCLMFDANGDGNIREGEAAQPAVMRILSDYDKGDTLKSLKGIEYFTNLEVLECSGSFTELDISKNIKLRSLYCFGNLTELDVSRNTVLEHLDCRNNKLTSLDLTHNPKLFGLDCSANPLTELDVSKNPKLSFLRALGTEITSLFFTEANASLTRVQVATNLIAIDVSKCTQLEELWVVNNHLTLLDISQNKKLKELHCQLNPTLRTIYVWKGCKPEAYGGDWTYDYYGNVSFEEKP